MEAVGCLFQPTAAATKFHSTSRFLSCIQKQPKDYYGTETNTKFGIITRIISRRLVLEVMGFNSMLVLQAAAAPTPVVEVNEPPQLIRTMKLPSGVQIEEIVEGEGPKAQEGDLVELNYVCRRYNGYFVHSTVDQFSGESTPVTLPLVSNQIIQGLKDVLVGMRVGGKRRALIPPSVGYVSEDLQPIPEEFGPRRSLLSHVNESLIFEVQLLKVFQG